MIKSARIMLYVDDIEQISQFWQTALKAQVIETNELPDDFENIVLKITPEVELSLFPTDYIKKYSPEVLDQTPALMFFATNFEKLHDSLAGASEIVDNNGVRTFNFSDPESNYFVIAEA